MSPTNQIQNQSATMMDTYRVGNAGAVKRIGTPHEHDVLSGRGGAINSHIGNTKFREWVRDRKNRYNLARTKAEKASVANEVMDLVKNQTPPGRFLQRDQSSSVTGGVTWWIEVDEVKAMAKTSQALREGAPSIRAAHKDELTVRKRTRKPNKKTSVPAHKTTPTTGKRSHHMMQQQQPSIAYAPTMTAPTAVAQVPIPAPAPAPVAAPVLSQSQAIQQLKANAEAAVAERVTENNIIPSSTLPPSYAPLPPLTNTAPASSLHIQPPVKRSRLSENLYLPTQPQPHIVRPDDETPPLAPLPSPMPLSSIPEMNESFPMPAIPKRETSIRRCNSLALSDVGSGNDSSWGDIDFVNPFDCDTSDEISAMPPAFGDYYTVRSRNSMSNMSVKSELSDLCDLATPVGVPDSDFGEQMKDVYDAVHPGLASPEENEPIPTHLYPYRGSYDLTQGGSPQLIC